MGEYEKTATEFVSEALDCCSLIQFNSNDPHELFALTIYGHCLELFASVHVLFSENHQAGSRAVLRQLIESYIDLVNLLKDSDGKYLAALQSADSRQWDKLVRASASGNSYVSGLDQAVVGTHLKRVPTQPFKIFEKFSKAGERELYEGLYTYACLGTHNGLSVLSKRYIEFSDETLKLSYFFSDADPTDLLTALDFGVKASDLVFGRFKVSRWNFGPKLGAIQLYARETRG
jgi:Family of unknown function (DUF5677)